MKFAALSSLFLLLCASSTFTQQIEITCSCAEPPGGSCRCDAGQVAICKIVNKRCSTECRTYSASATNEELAVQLLRDALDMRAPELGLSTEGRRTSETRSEASLQLLNALLIGQRGPVQYEALVPDMFRNPKAAPPIDSIQLGLPPDIAAKLRMANFRF